MSRESKSKPTDEKKKEKGGPTLTKELEDTFPASDPPSSTQPGSGITGPEVARPKE